MSFEKNELAAEVKSALAQRDAEFKAALDAHGTTLVNIQEEVKSGNTVSEELKNQLAANTAEIEAVKQKLAAPIENDVPELKSLGERFAESAEMKNWIERGAKGSSKRFEVKEISTGGASAGVLVMPDRQQGIITPPNQPVTLVRDLVMPGVTSTNSIEYLKELVFTNSAATVAEGALKPESDITFEDATAPVRKIAHWIRITDEALADAPQLASHINGRLTYGLKLKENSQLLLGDGTGTNLLGLIPQATAYETARNAVGDTKIDQLSHAAIQVFMADYAADGIVLNPEDWESIYLTKTDDKAYVFANPVAATGPRLWGLPVVADKSVPKGKFLVGSFKMAAQVFDRQQAAVYASTEDRDNFVTNRVTLLAEMRIALAVYRPASFVVGTFV